jgi:transposase
MAHLHKKMKKGRPYYYIREIKRVDGKPKVVRQIYLGSVEKIAERFSQARKEGKPVRLKSKSFGAMFIADQMEQLLDTIGIIDSIVPPGDREKGPGVGEYFYYAWVNRLISPKSKRALGDWYDQVAVDQIRPVSVKQLTSQRYWEKWDRVCAEHIDQIGKAFFERVWQLQGTSPECLLFDTTNYYTFMASDTESELCVRGHNKAGKHHLRQVGLSLLVDRDSHLPLFYRTYEGNTHDSKHFRTVIDEMFGVMCGFNQTKQRLTVVFDKGMNSHDVMENLDDHSRIHFITTYSPHFIEDLAGTDLKQFVPLDIEKNRQLIEKQCPDDCMMAIRRSMELWGQDRTVVVTHNPRTARKRQYTFDQKLQSVRATLIEFRRKYRDQAVHWRDPDTICERYYRYCEKLHIGSQYYQLEFGDRRKAPEMSFGKDQYQISKAISLFGKNVIVTDNSDWTTEEIVQLSLDRYGIEKQFRDSKSSNHVRVNPLYHWTDSKIRCHLLVCVIALTVLRLLEMKVNEQIQGDGEVLSGRKILQQMQQLNSTWLWYDDRRQPHTALDDPTELQSGVLKAFGWKIGPGGVLQKAEG